MQKITPKTIEGYIKKLQEKGYSSEQIQRKLEHLKNFLHWADRTSTIPIEDYPAIQSHLTHDVSPTTEATDGEITETPPQQTSSIFTSDSSSQSSSIKIHPAYYVGAIITMILLLLMGGAFYKSFFQKTSKILAYPSTPVTASRIVSFQGRLTDSLGNPITAATNMRFRLYTASSGGSTLYDSGTCSITPDSDGIHNVLVGSSCGSEIASTVFSENANVYLGVTVGSDSEMTPRQQIANVGYAINSETLQGFPLGTSASTVPYIDNQGDVRITAATPSIISNYASETFVVGSANAVTVQAAGSGDVTLTATESGTIKFLTAGTQAGVITNAQLFGIGTSGPDAKVDSLSTSGEQLRLTYTDGSAYVGFTTSSGGDLTVGASGGDFAFTDTSNTLFQIKDQGTYPFVTLAGKSTSGDPASCAEGDIYYNDADDSIKICHESNTWEGLDGGGTAVWTDSGTTSYLTDTTDEVVIGGTSPLSSSKFSIDGDADQIQLLVQGNATQTSSLAVFEQSDGTDLLTISGAGVLSVPYLVDISNTAYGLDPAGTSNFGGYSQKITGGALLALDSGSVGIGTSGPDAKLDVASTTEQLRLSYTDGAVYSSYTVDSSGNLTIDNTGTKTVIADDLQVTGNDILDSSATTRVTLGATTTLTNTALTLSGTATLTASSLTAFNCSDCIDFDDLEDTLDLDTALIVNQGTNTWTQNFTGTTATTGLTYAADSLTTGTGIELSADALSSGKGLYVSSTSTALTSGNLLSLDWTPGSATTATGDLFKINIGPNGNVSNLLNITDNSTSLFRVSENQIESAVPHAFTAAGDVSIAYDLLFSNQTASYIKSNAPLTIEAGESFESNDLTLKTYNNGDLVLDLAGGATFAQAQAWDIANSSTTSLNIESGLLDLDTTNSRVGIGTTGPDAKLDVLSTTEQLRLTYTDGSAYTSFTTSSGGDLTIAPSGSDTSITGTLSISGNTTLGDASGDTVTSNAATWTFANDTNFALSGGVNGISFDTSTLSIDATNDKVGIGTTAPDGKLHVTGAITGKALTILNETGNQNILVASSSGAIKLGIDSNGDVGKGFSHGVIGLNDQASLAPNASFETFTAETAMPDGWLIKNGTATTTTTSKHGDTAMILPSYEDEIYSTCFPMATNNSRQYTMSLWTRDVTAPIGDAIQAGIYTHASRSDCETNTNPTTLSIISQSVTNMTYTSKGASGTPTATDHHWARAFVKNNSAVATTEDVYVDGVLLWPATNTGGLDLAETYPTKLSDRLEPGHIVAFGTEIQDQADVPNVVKTSKQYDSKGFGVVATQPGILLDDYQSYPKVNVALKGRVPVLVVTENGPIKIGDPITASSIPGIGMKATNTGKIIGYAMTEYENSDSTSIDQVTVFVNPEMYNPPTEFQAEETDLDTATLEATYSGSILPQQEAYIVRIGNRIVDKSQALTSALVANLTAGYIKARTLLVDTLQATSASISQLTTRDLQAETIAAAKLTSQRIEAESIKTEKLESKSIASDTIKSKKVDADELSGATIEEIQSRLLRVSQQQEDIASDSGELDRNIAEVTTNVTTIAKSLSELKDASLADTSQYQPSEGTSFENLTVSDSSNLYNLFVSGSFSTDDIYIENNSISSFSDTLALNALQNIDLLDGAVVIARNGDITSKGQIIAEKGIRTNSIKAVNPGQQINVQLESGTDSLTGNHTEGSLNVTNDQGTPVAQINKNGNAKFNTLSLDTQTSGSTIIAASESAQLAGLYIPGIETNSKAAGVAILPAQVSHVLLYNDMISNKSLMYITPTSNTYNKSIFVSGKEDCSANTQGKPCKKYFKVSIDQPLPVDTQFNWWIIN